MRIEIPSHSTREDIHAIEGDIMTLLSDQTISIGDEIVCPHKITKDFRLVYNVEDILEKRLPMGVWTTEPPNLYKLKIRKSFEKREVNGKEEKTN